MKEHRNEIHQYRYWLSVVTGAILGGAYLVGLISLVYVLGSLAEGLTQ